MGTENMKYSLVSREIIADSIEAVMACQGYDGIVAVGGCDKNMPGCLMGIARLNEASYICLRWNYFTRKHNGKQLDVVSVFEAIGAEANNLIPLKELKAIESKAIPGPGSCGGMYTANTMASAIEAMGMSLPNSSAQAAVSKSKLRDCTEAGKGVMKLVKKESLKNDNDKESI